MAALQFLMVFFCAQLAETFEKSGSVIETLSKVKETFLLYLSREVLGKSLRLTSFKIQDQKLGPDRPVVKADDDCAYFSVMSPLC